MFPPQVQFADNEQLVRGKIFAPFSDRLQGEWKRA